MNKFQKDLNKAVRKNIELFPLWGKGSFYKRRKLFREVFKLKEREEGDEAEPYCPECGEFVEEDSTYCSNCGQRLEWN